MDSFATQKNRQRQLMEKYYFSCLCSRCTNPQEVLEMNAAKCPNSKCNEFVYIELKSCQRCNAIINQEHRNEYYEVTSLTKNYLESEDEKGTSVSWSLLK